MNPSERKAYQKLSYVDRATRYLENTGTTWSSFKVSHFVDEVHEAVMEELENERRIARRSRWELRTFMISAMVVAALRWILKW